MSDAVSAFGAILTWETYEVAELTKVESPEVKINMLEVTHHGSPGGFREYVAGLKDGGEIAIEGNFISSDTTGQIALLNASYDGTIGAVEIILSDDSVFSCDCLVTGFKVNSPFDDKLSFTASLKVNGLPVFTAPGS